MKRSLLCFPLFFCLFLVACGGSSGASSTLPNSNSTNSSSTLAPANGPTALHVTRTDPSAAGKLGPLDKMVTDIQAVQKLYRMALALPAYAVGSSISQSCLNDLGVIYHLSFLQGKAEVQRMNLDPGNCKILYLSQTDLRQANDAFLNFLKQILRVNSLTSN